MANVKFSKKLFEREIGKLDEKMQENIFLFGTPVESLTEDEREILLETEDLGRIYIPKHVIKEIKPILKSTSFKI